MQQTSHEILLPMEVLIQQHKHRAQQNTMRARDAHLRAHRTLDHETLVLQLDEMTCSPHHCPSDVGLQLLPCAQAIDQLSNNPPRKARAAETRNPSNKAKSHDNGNPLSKVDVLQAPSESEENMELTIADLLNS